jgi:hypothetical protein
MVQAAPIDAQSPRGFETRFRCLSQAPDTSSASSFVAPPDLAALRRIRGRVGDRRARPLVSNVSRYGVKGGIRPPRIRIWARNAAGPASRRVPPSRTRSISRDRSVQRLSADSPEVVSRFEFAAGRSKEILKTNLGTYTRGSTTRRFRLKTI